MYLGDHPPPHGHVVLREGRDAIVEIDSLAVIGKLAVREIRDALDWISARKALLLGEWQRYNPRANFSTPNFSPSAHWNRTG
ncbi:MAG: DUF4160 domain-containing protein [Rhodoferax sp.]|nr:DUF4160 domain-containing protein [Rhodoferax sp.]